MKQVFIWIKHRRFIIFLSSGSDGWIKLTVVLIAFAMVLAWVYLDLHRWDSASYHTEPLRVTEDSEFALVKRTTSPTYQIANDGDIIGDNGVSGDAVIERQPREADASKPLDIVRQFADNVLEKGKDRWSGQNTPLLANGINIETGEPVRWIYRDDRARKASPNPLLMDRWQGKDAETGQPKEWTHPENFYQRYADNQLIFHNLASQQNLFRTLVGLSNLTGDNKYRLAAEQSLRYHFAHLRSECGLLRWGRVQFIDLRTLRPVAPWRISSHGLKTAYPFYELMWEVDSAATTKFVGAFWNALIWDWETLDMNRHGPFGLKAGKLWDHPFKQPAPFFEGAGLSFLNAGSDLIYAGSMLYVFNQEEGALTWSKRLAEQYVRARHPKTGLAVHQYSKMKPIQQTPENGPIEDVGHLGDRAESQFGKYFPQVANEGWVFFNGAFQLKPALMQLELSERLGEKGNDLRQATVDGLKSFAMHAYMPERNQFRPMWADGTDLTGYTFPRSGYYGREGTVLKPYKPNGLFLFSFSRAYRISKDEYLWETLRSMFNGLDLGDPGTTHGQSVALNLKTDNADPLALFALLELTYTSENPAYLTMAKVVGNNIVKQHFHHGFFLPDENHINVNFDAIEPLALLSLEAAIRGTPELVPVFSGGANATRGYFGDLGDTTDDAAIWLQER